MNTTKGLTEEQVRIIIRRLLRTREARDVICTKWGIRRQYLSNILSHPRSLPYWLLQEFGYTKKKITVYEKVEA